MGYKELSQIQKKLKVPKGQYNSYGDFKYRSCEDICEAVKPILAEMGAALVLEDEVQMIGDRFYIKATATIVFEDGSTVHSTAFAREELTKKGMDSAQITGSCSSYARKYALNGLLCIDDTKDPDTMDNKGDSQNGMEEWCKKHHVNINDLCQFYGVPTIGHMTPDRLEHFNANKNALIKQLGGK